RAGTAASRGQARERERGDEEEGKVVRPDSEGGDDDGRGEIPLSRGLAGGEQEEREVEQGEQRISSRLSGVEHQQRRNGGQKQEKAARPSARQCSHGREEEQDREPRERSRDLVGQSQRL